MHKPNIHIISIQKKPNSVLNLTDIIQDENVYHIAANAQHFVLPSDLIHKLTLDSFQNTIPMSLAIKNEFSCIHNIIATHEDVVFLCYGDPLYYGIGSSLVKTFGIENVAIYYNNAGISILQRMCQKIGLNPSTVQTVSLHGRNSSHDWHTLNIAFFSRVPICILTDKHSSIQRIAKEALNRGITGTLYVLQRYGMEDEQFFSLSMESAASDSRETLLPCTVLFMPQMHSKRPYLGIPEHEFTFTDNLITKTNARAVALSLLELQQNTCLWDIGSGSGSLAIEACALAPKGHIICFESNVQRYQNILSNRHKFGASIMDVHNIFFPKDIEELPMADRIFIGGGLSGANSQNFLNEVCNKLKPEGHIVVSCVLMGTFEDVKNYFTQAQWHMQIIQVSCNVSSNLLNDIRLVPQNPIFFIKVTKPLA